MTFDRLRGVPRVLRMSNEMNQSCWFEDVGVASDAIIDPYSFVLNITSMKTTLTKEQE